MATRHVEAERRRSRTRARIGQLERFTGERRRGGKRGLSTGRVRLPEHEVAPGGGVGVPPSAMKAQVGVPRWRGGVDESRDASGTSLSIWAEARRVGESVRACRQWAIRRCGTSLSPEGQGVNRSRLLLSRESRSDRAQRDRRARHASRTSSGSQASLHHPGSRLG